jgi:hypothetical protein
VQLECLFAARLLHSRGGEFILLLVKHPL